MHGFVDAITCDLRFLENFLFERITCDTRVANRETLIFRRDR